MRKKLGATLSQALTYALYGYNLTHSPNHHTREVLLLTHATAETLSPKAQAKIQQSHD